MRSGSRGLALALSGMVLAASFIGCPLLKKKNAGDAGDEELAATDATAVEAGGLGAKNEASVLRYGNERPLANEPGVVGADGAKVRAFPGNGPEVATLPQGTAVTKVAQYFQTGTLVLFDDPTGEGRLLGWVTPSALDPGVGGDAAPVPSVAPSAAPTVAPTVVPTVVPTAAKDAGAPTKDAGTSVQDAGTSIKDAGVAVKDAGAAIKDAGAAIKDAGVAVKDAGVAAKDAGAAPKGALPQPGRGVLAVPPVDGKCPEGWTVTEGLCRRKCTADAECPRNTKCVVKQGAKVCSSS